MNFEFMTIDTPLPPCMPFPRALTGFPVSSTAKLMYCRMLDAMLSKGQEDENGILPIGEHSVQHPAVHDLCGAADWKPCQRSWKSHTGRQWCVYRHKFKIHSVCSSFFFARLDK